MTSPKDLSVCPVADMRSGVVFSLGEVSCRIHYIERNVVVIWRRNVAPSLHFASPPPKCESTIRECQSITALWLRPRSRERRPTAVSHFDSSDLADGVLWTPRTVRSKDPRAVATRTPLSAPPWGHPQHYESVLGRRQ
jgi:hypothetical protein